MFLVFSIDCLAFATLAGPTFPPFPDTFAEVWEAADDIIADKVTGAVEDIVNQIKILGVIKNPMIL